MRNLVIIMLAMCLLAGCAMTKAQSPEAQLKGTISEIITLLESAKYREVFERYVDPESVEKFKSEGRFEKTLDNFKSKKSEGLLKNLKKALSLTPYWDESKTRAAYKSDEFPRDLRFKKIGDKWYIMN